MKRASALALISVGISLLSAAEGCGSSDDSILAGLPGQNGCNIDAECGGDNPICQAGRCVECTAASQCNVSGQTCDAVTSACKSTCSRA